MKNWLRKKLRSFLGIDDIVEQSINRERIEEIIRDNTTKIIQQHICELLTEDEPRWSWGSPANARAELEDIIEREIADRLDRHEPKINNRFIDAVVKSVNDKQLKK